MGRNVARFFITLVGLFVGPGVAVLVFELLQQLKIVNVYTDLYPWVSFTIFVASGVVSGIILLPALFGLIAGLVVAYLLSQLVNNIMGIDWLAGIINVIIYIVCVYLGISVLIRYRPEMAETGFFRRHKDPEKSKDYLPARPKLLDTSVIIDGRIFDICNTGVIEGALIIPEFVLDELRHIADSSDDLKRNRGRRGLDVLKRIQTELDLPVKIVHAEVDEAADVDS